MSAAKPKTVAHKRKAYLEQNRGRALTVAQERQLRKTAVRAAARKRTQARERRRQKAGAL